MRFKIGRLKIFLVIVGLMFFHKFFFCPCYAVKASMTKSDDLIGMLENGKNLNLDDIKKVVQAKPSCVTQTCAAKNEFRKTAVYYALYKGENTEENRVDIAKYLFEEILNQEIAQASSKAKLEDIEEIERQVKREGKCIRMWENGATVLHYAAASNNVDFAEWLLARGIDPNIVDDEKRPPIYWAALHGSVDVAKKLIEKGAKLDYWDKYNGSLLHVAARKGHYEFVKFILSKSKEYVNKFIDNVYATPLHIAASNGNLEIAKLLLDNGADPNSGGFNGFDCYTPLHIAASDGNIALVQLLLDNKADPNIKSISIYAREQRLVRLGFDPKNLPKFKGPTDKSECGDTPLHEAVRNGNVELVKLLISRGADPGCMDDDGIMPLQLAKIYENWDVVNILESYEELIKSIIGGKVAKLRSCIIKPEFNPNFVYGGDPLLHIACRCKGDRSSTVKLLLDAGADPNLTGKDDKTPEQLAREGNHVKILHMLKSKVTGGSGVDPVGTELVADTKGDSASVSVDRKPRTTVMKKRDCIKLRAADLYMAIQHGVYDKVLSLIGDGVDPNYVYYHCDTPLKVACRCDGNRYEIIDLLLQKGADPNFAGKKKRDALALTECGGLVKSCDLFEDKKSSTPLHIAVMCKQKDYVQLLIDRGAELNPKDKEGKTPLDLCEDPEIAALLIAHGGKCSK